jgi:23S rRNA (pseudouridine1915-N3)-methyltransferase
MKISIISPGNFGNSPHKTVFEEYRKRLKWKLELKEIELKNAQNLSSEKLKEGEAQLISKHVKSGSVIIALDERGKEFSSVEFAKLLADFAVQGNSEISFVIGGADGLAKEILQQAQQKIAFGKMTFPHLMVRAMLAEQLYRAETIINKHPYHRQ